MVSPSRRPSPPRAPDLSVVLVRLLDEVAGGHPHPSEQGEQGLLLVATEHPESELRGLEVGRRRLHRGPTGVGDHSEGATAVSRVGDALDEALRNAIALRSPERTIVHSDRGSQFRSKKVVRLLKNNGLRGSMGRVGSSGDNAAMESFFSLLQKNVLNKRRWQSRQGLRLEIVTWIERIYRRRRRQRRLKRLTPIEFVIVNSQAACAA